MIFYKKICLVFHYLQYIQKVEFFKEIKENQLMKK